MVNFKKDEKSSGMYFFFNATATNAIYTLSLHDALPIQKLLGHAPSLKEIIAFIEMERYGKATVQEFVANMSQQDIVNRFNEDYSKNMNHMFAGGSKGCEHGKGSFTI